MDPRDESGGTVDGARQYWVFGYGSLIWRPGFEFVASRPALLRGAHRSLCIYSHHHRGTRERPGLVLGLVPGGSCQGMAYAVSAPQWDGVVEYLRAREQVTGVYREVVRPVRLASGETVPALTYVVDPAHAQYAGRLGLEEQAKLVAAAVGDAGPNADYVLNTVAHLEKLGINDKALFTLGRLLGDRLATA